MAVREIRIAGPGCPRCEQTERNVFNACAELGLAADIGHIRDMKEYGKFGVAITPAVIVDGKVLVAGRVPTVAELKGLLSKL
jgi:small redox-active disulfide protein 2